MNILKRYISKELIGPFFLGLAVFTFTMLMQQIIELTDLVIYKGVSIGIIVKLFLYVLPYFLMFTIPMAILLATLLAFGRLSHNNEITAIQAAGINLWILIRPVLVIGLILCIALAVFNNLISPKSKYAFRGLCFDIVDKQAGVILQPRIWISDFDGLILHAEEMDEKTGEMFKVTLYQLNDESPPKTIFAQRGKLISNPENLEVGIKLFQGTMHATDVKDPERYHVLSFGTHFTNLDIHSALQRNHASPKRVEEMTTKELIQHIEEVRIRGEIPRWQLVKLHQRFSFAFAPIAFILIGVPLGIKTHRSTKSIGFAISFVLTFIYYFIMLSGEHLGGRGSFPPGLAIWFPNIFLGLIGIFLTIRMMKK
jgi:lipopolysaccharide export system permease protein